MLYVTILSKRNLFFFRKKANGGSFGSLDGCGKGSPGFVGLGYGFPYKETGFSEQQSS